MATLTSVFTSIANAIRGKNGSSDTYTPEEMATAISEIETGIDTSDATATAGDILATKTAYAVGEKVTGNMTNNGAVSPSGLNCGGSYTIPAGYHNGQGVVSANSLASQTGVDSGKTAVGAGQMVSGYQGWVNGSKVTGTFTGQEKSATPSTSSQNITPDSGKYLTKVTVGAISTQEKTITSSRSAQTVTPDSGKYLSKVTVNGLAPTGTFNAGTTRGTAVDMGATSNYRYVNTNSVANSNSGTYTFAANDTGGTKDLGATNTYRYVNASNVYAKGKADGSAGASGQITIYNGNEYTINTGLSAVHVLVMYIPSMPNISYIWQTFLASQSKQFCCGSNYAMDFTAPTASATAQYYYTHVKSVSGGTVKIAGSLFASGGMTLKWWAW